MGFTREQLDAVEAEIVALKVGTFSIGELSIDQEKTLAALMKLREVIKTHLAKSEGMTFGKVRVDGID
jgi:hypothetical protein